MNIREISDVFKDTAADITALKSYNFGWASDRVRQGNTEDFQELNAFPRVFFSVPTITGSDQTRKQDTYQVTLFFDDLLGYDNEGDADLTLQIDKWAALQQYATAFIQRLNLIKQTILPNYLFIPEPPQFIFDSFVGIQRLVTVQVNFNLVVPTNCEVTVQRIINVVGNVIASGIATGNIFLSTSVSALIECTASATGAIVSGQQNVVEVESSVTAFALASGDIVTVKTVAASVVSTATVNAEVQRAVNVIGQLNATGQVSGDISLTLFAIGSVDARATVDANLEVTTQGVTECEANVTGTGVMNGLLFVIRTLEAQSIAQATSQSEIILSKLLSGFVIGSGVSEGSVQLGLKVDASIEARAISEASLEVTTQNVTTFEAFVIATATSEASIQRIISVESSVDTTVTTSAEATLTRVLDASATATAQTSSDAQITIPINASADATAETSAQAFITRIISADATATANSSAEAGIGTTFVAAAVATATSSEAALTRVATIEASVTASATITDAALDAGDSDALAFFARVTTAGGTLSATEQNAVNTLVLQMKADGIWTKMKAIYPMVGASAAACAQNLKSSSFTGTFTNGWTFASTGVKPNGTSAYMNTNLNPKTEINNANDGHLSYYSRTENTGGFVEMGTADGETAFDLIINYNTSAGACINMVETSNVFTYTGTTKGLFIGSQNNTANVRKFFRDNTLIQTQSSTQNIQPNTIISVGARGALGNIFYTNRECAFASIGNGLSDTEASNFYIAVQAFQLTLNRNV
tara:strand:+ start:1411 stop:3708 length:2298 start_codon:yes stop_codon:yes gene_type:complete